MKKLSRLHRATIMRTIFVLLSTGVLWLVLPIETTLISRDLSDMKLYLAALEIQLDNMAMQKTLAPGEEVITTYGDQPKYFQAVNTCNWQFLDSCAQVMTGPGVTYPKAYIYYERQGPFLERLRMGQVFPVSALIKGRDESLWYKIDLNGSRLLFPNRIRTDWYVPAEFFTPVDFTPINPQHDAIKRIVIVLHEQMLYAYEGDKLFLKTSISTGRQVWSLGTTPGKFGVYKKNPMAIMEGPLPSMASMMTSSNVPDFEYTLFVPFAMAYYPDVMGTAFIHSAYWHNGFGTQRSHGCVNVNYQDAPILYNWTPDPSIVNVPVTVLP